MKLAVVGLGRMGLGMAGSLARAGHTVSGHDITEAPRAAAEALGVVFQPDLAALLAEAEIVVLSLPYARDVAAVVERADGLLARPGAGVVVVDTTTSDPATSRRLAALLAAAGHGFLDAPVSGGPSGAAAGTLTMMIGGAPEDLTKARPALEAMAGNIVHVGPSGAGNIAKLVNNLLVAAQLVTAREAMRLSQAAGLPVEAVLPVVNAATGRSAITEAMLPRWVLPGSFDSGFSAGLMRKDLRLALALAEDCGLAVPLSAEAGRLWEALRDGALPDSADFTRMADYRAGESA